MVPRVRTLAAGVSFAWSTVLAASEAEAEAEGPRVAVLGPSDSSLVARLVRNAGAMGRQTVTASTALCTRDVVVRLDGELSADAVLCFDGDAIGVWRREGDRMKLADVVVRRGDDERAEELDAARATLLLSDDASMVRKDAEAAGPLTIVTAPTDTATGSPASTAPSADTGRAKPVLPQKKERMVPRATAGVGPALMSSQDGSLFAVSAQGEIGVTRNAAVAPWIALAPAGAAVEATSGSAKYRPALFGLGFDIALRSLESVLVPRVGAGYAMLWVHVSPESAKAPAVVRGSEDILAPVIYANLALAVRVTSRVRIVGEAIGGISSHEVDVRIAGQTAARWGGPLSTLALRGEWVMP